MAGAVIRQADAGVGGWGRGGGGFIDTLIPVAGGVIRKAEGGVQAAPRTSGQCDDEKNAGGGGATGRPAYQGQESRFWLCRTERQLCRFVHCACGTFHHLSGPCSHHMHLCRAETDVPVHVPGAGHHTIQKSAHTALHDTSSQDIRFPRTSNPQSIPCTSTSELSHLRLGLLWASSQPLTSTVRKQTSSAGGPLFCMNGNSPKMTQNHQFGNFSVPHVVPQASNGTTLEHWRLKPSWRVDWQGIGDVNRIQGGKSALATIATWSQASVVFLAKFITPTVLSSWLNSCGKHFDV